MFRIKSEKNTFKGSKMFTKTIIALNPTEIVPNGIEMLLDYYG